jgi:hypothetical protein
MRKDCQKENVSESDYKQREAKLSQCMGLRQSLGYATQY